MIPDQASAQSRATQGHRQLSAPWGLATVPAHKSTKRRREARAGPHQAAPARRRSERQDAFPGPASPTSHWSSCAVPGRRCATASLASFRPLGRPVRPVGHTAPEARGLTASSSQGTTVPVGSRDPPEGSEPHPAGTPKTRAPRGSCRHRRPLGWVPTASCGQGTAQLSGSQVPGAVSLGRSARAVSRT